MTEILYTFEANTSELNYYMILGLIAFFICALLFFYSIKKHKPLLMMFSGFLGIIGLGVSVLTYVNQTKLPTIQLFENGMTTPQGQVHFDNIRKIELKELKEHSKYPIHKDGQMITLDTSRLILIEEYSGKAHVMSEVNYPLTEIFGQLSVLVKNYQDKNKIKEETEE